jgi:hypothetical protein
MNAIPAVKHWAASTTKGRNGGPFFRSFPMSYLLALCAAIICAGIVFAAYLLDEGDCEACGGTGELEGVECLECKGERRL